MNLIEKKESISNWTEHKLTSSEYVIADPFFDSVSIIQGVAESSLIETTREKQFQELGKALPSLYKCDSITSPNIQKLPEQSINPSKEIKSLIETSDTILSDDHKKSGFNEKEVHEILQFLKSHQTEIIQIYENKKVKNWEELGKGQFKQVFTHDEFHGYVIKFEKKSNEYIIPWDLPEGENFRVEFEKISQARKVVAEQGYQHIKIPKVLLVKTPLGPILIEEKM